MSVAARHTLADGFYDVPSGKVAFVVTSLEMRAPPPARPKRGAAAFTIRSIESPSAGWYRNLFERIGGEWLWFSRLALASAGLEAIVQHPDVAIYTLQIDGRDEGLLELDFRVPGECELAFFGLTASTIGRGAGRALMSFAITEAWKRPISRFWVHTCTGDHPSAVQFYVRSGFTPYRRQIEIADDPRLAGVLGRRHGAHVPIIEP